MLGGFFFHSPCFSDVVPVDLFSLTGTHCVTFRCDLFVKTVLFLLARELCCGIGRTE